MEASTGAANPADQTQLSSAPPLATASTPSATPTPPPPATATPPHRTTSLPPDPDPHQSQPSPLIHPTQPLTQPLLPGQSCSEVQSGPGIATRCQTAKHSEQPQASSNPCRQAKISSSEQQEQGNIPLDIPPEEHVPPSRKVTRGLSQFAVLDVSTGTQPPDVSNLEPDPPPPAEPPLDLPPGNSPLPTASLRRKYILERAQRSSMKGRVVGAINFAHPRQSASTPAPEVPADNLPLTEKSPGEPPGENAAVLLEQEQALEQALPQDSPNEAQPTPGKAAPVAKEPEQSLPLPLHVYANLCQRSPQSHAIRLMNFSRYLLRTASVPPHLEDDFAESLNKMTALMLDRRGVAALHLLPLFPPLYKGLTIGSVVLQDLPKASMGMGVLPIRLTTLLVDLFANRMKKEGQQTPCFLELLSHKEAKMGVLWRRPRKSVFTLRLQNQVSWHGSYLIDTSFTKKERAALSLGRLFATYPVKLTNKVRQLMADTFQLEQEQQVVFTLLYAQMCHQVLQLLGLSNYYTPKGDEAVEEIVESIQQERSKGVNPIRILFDTQKAANAYLDDVPVTGQLQAQLALDHVGLLPQFVAEIQPRFEGVKRFMLYLMVTCFSFQQGAEAIPQYLILLAISMLQHNYYLRVVATRALIRLGEDPVLVKKYKDYTVLQQRLSPEDLYEKFPIDQMDFDQRLRFEILAAYVSFAQDGLLVNPRHRVWLERHFAQRDILLQIMSFMTSCLLGSYTQYFFPRRLEQELLDFLMTPAGKQLCRRTDTLTIDIKQTLEGIDEKRKAVQAQGIQMPNCKCS